MTADLACARPTHAGDIPPRCWNGAEIDCSRCAHAALRALPGDAGCEPGHACMQDVYARRIDRFEPEVRRIAAQRLPAPLLGRLVADTDWRVRWEVAQRAEPAVLVALREDEDAEVRAAARERLAARPAAAVLPCPSGALHG